MPNVFRLDLEWVERNDLRLPLLAKPCRADMSAISIMVSNRLTSAARCLE